MSALHQRMSGGGGEVDSRPRRQLSPSSSQHRLNSSSSSQPSNLQNKDDQDSTRRLYAAVAASVPSASSSPRSARHASERTPQLVGFTSRNDQGSSSRQGTPRQQLSASSSRPPAAAQQYGRSSSSSNSDSSSDSSRSSFTESDNDDDEEIETLITVSQKTGKSIGLIRELNPSLQDVRDHDPLEPGLQLVLTRRRTAPTLLRPPAAATEEDDRPLRKAVSEMPPRESRYPPEQRTETRVVDASPRSGQPAPTATVGSPSGSVGRDAAPVTLRRLGSKLRVPIADLQKGALADCGPDDPISYGLLQQEQYQGKSLASWLVGDPSAALPPVAATQTHQSSSSPSVHRSTAAAAPPPSAPAPNSGGRALPSSLSPAPPATITPTGMHIPPLPLSSMAAVSATHRSCPPPPPPPGMSSSSSNVPYRPLTSDRAVAVLSNASTPRNGSRCVTPNKLLSPRHPRASSPERDGGGPFGESFTSIPTLHDGPDGLRQRELDRSESNVLRNRRAGHKVFAVPYWHCRSSNNRDNKISSRHAGAQPSNRKESSSSSCSPSLSEKRQWTLKLVARDVAGLSVNDLLNLNPEMETLFRLDEALPAGTAIVVPPNAQILHWEGEDEPPQQQQQQNETPLLLLGRQSRSSSAASQTNNNLNGSTSNTQKHSMSRGSSAAASGGDGGGGVDYADCSPGPTKRRPLLSDRPSSSGSRPSASHPPPGRLFPNASSRNINHTPLGPAAASGNGGGASSTSATTTNSQVEAITVEPIQPSSHVGMTMKEISVSVGTSEAELYALNVHLQHAAPDDMLASNAMIYVPVSQRQRKHHQDPTAEQRSKSPSMSLATATHYSSAGGSAAPPQPQLSLPPRATYQRLTPRSKSEVTTTSVAAQLLLPHDASSSVPHHHKSVSEAAHSQRDVSLPQNGDADAGGFEDVSPVRHTRIGGARSVLESQASHPHEVGMAGGQPKERTEGSYSVSQSSAPPIQHPNEFSTGKQQQQQSSLPAVSVSSGGAPSGTLVIGRFAITKPHLTVQSIADRLGIAADWIYDLNIAELVDRPGGVYHSQEPLPLGLVLSLPKL